MITVTVTQEDVDKGVKNSFFHCPIAIALTRAIGKPVGTTPIFFWVGYEPDTYRLPHIVTGFIRAFDSPDYPDVPPTIPFKFEIEYIAI